MKIGLYMTETEGEGQIEKALIAGFKYHGEQTTVIHTHYYNKKDLPQYDLIVFVGVRRKSRRIYNHAKEINAHTLMIDKGYMARGQYYRFAVDGIQPKRVPGHPYSDERLRSFGITIKPRSYGATILFAGSSQKYCDFHELGDASAYADHVCGQLNELLPGRVVYRPKPSWWGRLVDKRVPKGAVLSGPDEPIEDALRKAACVVTHGSNTGIEALISGVPVVTTAYGPEVNPIYHLAGHSLEQIANPPFPSEDVLRDTLSELAWCQFSLHEVARGFAWTHTRWRLLE
jgi:hypothetical protein